jgi:hypothetical protein
MNNLPKEIVLKIMLYESYNPTIYNRYSYKVYTEYLTTKTLWITN